MSRAKVARSSFLSGLVESDSEDGLNGNAFGIAKPAAIAKGASKQRAGNAMAPAAKTARGRQPANKVTKPAQPKKASTRRNNGQLAAAIEEAAEEESRTALVEKSSNAQPKAAPRGRKKAAAAPAEEEEEDDVVMEDAPEEPATKPRVARGRPKKVIAADEPKEAAKPTRRAPAGRKAATKVELVVPEEEDMTEIPETQPPGAYPGDSEEGGGDDDQLEDLPASDPVEKTRQIPSSPSKRPLYSSSSEGGSDPALRRRLGDMTQKYESLERKYLDLKEVAVREAERNFDRLKKQTDERAKAAEQLIATLKSEVAAQKEEAKEAIRLKKQLDDSTTKADDLQTRVTSLTTSLAEAKTEIKALTMKLSAARSAEASAVAKTVPGSAMKGGHGNNFQQQQQATLSAQLKEDLYGDLTGLIIRGVKRDGAEDIYDCIQTSRNGTLHFKLAIANDASENFDDAQFLYMPQLDPNRDRALIDMLPDYLVEEITFPRPHAAKFYARVMKALTEQL